MAKLVIYKNQSMLITLELDSNKDYIAGRAPECSIVLDDVVFSRQHFKLFFANGKWTVQSISKYSQLAINHRESDYFTLKNDDKFSTFTYEFLFQDDSTATSEEIATDANSNSEALDISDKTIDLRQDDHSDDERTFVPQMTSQEWSIGVPYILLRKSDGSTQTMRLEGDYWIMGRDDGCDIVIDDPKASREHCEVFHKQNKYYIVDKESSNGTLLNYKKISPNRDIPLKSGDQIQIGKALFIFEIRDPLFAEKLTNLPTDTINYPTHPLNYGIENNSSKKVIRVNSEKEKKKKIMMIGGSLVLLLFMYFLSGDGTSNNKDLSSEDGTQARAIDVLTAEQKDLVEKSYTLAKTLYTQGKYELALTEVEKIHSLIPEYRDSKEIAQFSKNAIDTLMERKDIERREEEQRKLLEKVAAIVEQCGSGYNSHHNMETLQECLSPAIELDPENARAAELLEIAQQEDIRKDAIAERRQFYSNQIDQRRRLFYRAENLKKQGKILDAISAYSRHIASSLPDPSGLEARSRNEVKHLQHKINEEISKLTSEAESLYANKEYKEAIFKLEEALKLNPQNSNVKDTYNTYSKELHGKVKNLYADSVLEENLGDIESAKSKWKKIRKIDVPHGEYYKKSGLKLKKYGL